MGSKIQCYKLHSRTFRQISVVACSKTYCYKTLFHPVIEVGQVCLEKGNDMVVIMRLSFILHICNRLFHCLKLEESVIQERGYGT